MGHYASPSDVPCYADMEDMTEAPNPDPSDRCAHFRIVEEIARGGMGVVRTWSC